MYPNIKAELSRYRLNVAELAEYMQTSHQNLYNKLNGKTTLSYGDMKKIQEFFIEKVGGAFSLDYLFDTQANNGGN